MTGLVITLCIVGAFIGFIGGWGWGWFGIMFWIASFAYLCRREF